LGASIPQWNWLASIHKPNGSGTIYYTAQTPRGFEAKGDTIVNDKIWLIDTPTAQETVTCEICGVAQDGSLICFVMDPTGQQPQAVRGYAPGQWLKFQRSSIRSN
jgi:hypothetical protein